MGGNSLRHSLTVSRSCCWTPGCSQRGGQEAPTKKTSGMSAFLTPAGLAVHFWDVGRGPSGGVGTVPALSPGTATGLDGLGSGGFGVLESWQCFVHPPSSCPFPKH